MCLKASILFQQIHMSHLEKRNHMEFSFVKKKYLNEVRFKHGDSRFAEKTSLFDVVKWWHPNQSYIISSKKARDWSIKSSSERAFSARNLEVS